MYYTFFTYYLLREEKIERKRFENKEAWTAHLEKLKIFGAARKTPPSPLPPVYLTNVS